MVQNGHAREAASDAVVARGLAHHRQVDDMKVAGLADGSHSGKTR